MANLYVISGSSGVGKGTVIKQFLENNPEFKLSVSCTTRTPRAGEVDTINYFFITKDEFKKSIENNDFLEWEEFSGNLYGTKKSYIEKCISENKKIILEIDTKGALHVKELIPDAKLIFILPPSVEELEHRLRGRHTETEEAIQKRLSQIKFEMENSKQFDYQVVNGDIASAVKKLEEIMCV